MLATFNNASGFTYTIVIHDWTNVTSYRKALKQRMQLSLVASIAGQLKNKWWEMHALCKLKLSTRTWSRYVNRHADQHTHTHTVFFRTVDVERGRSFPGLTTTFPISSPSQALCISQVQVHGSFKCHTPASEARHDHLCLLVHHPKSHGDGGL